MFKFKFIKILGNKKPEDENLEEPKESIVEKSKNFISRFLSNFDSFKNSLINDIITTIEKLKNLEETNYKLSVRLIKENRIDEAIFRLKFLLKFWPNNIKGKFNLAYCYYLKHKYEDSLKYINIIMENGDIDEKLKEKTLKLNEKVTEIINQASI